MNAFDVLGDPVRRRLIELLATGDRGAGELTQVIRDEFGISQPAVSNQLRVLRESGFAHSERRGSGRLYALQTAALDDAAEWVGRQRGFWEQRLDALDTEVGRGRRKTR